MPKAVPYHRPPGQPADRHREYNKVRDKVLNDLYSSSPWKKFRACIRAERILCEPCKANGRDEVGVIVHHLKDPRDAPDLAFEDTNVLLVCRACHAKLDAEGRGRNARR